MKFLTLSLIILVAVGVSACTGPQGPAGAQGYQGQTGRSGADTVIVAPAHPSKTTTVDTVILTPVR